MIKEIVISLLLSLGLPILGFACLCRNPDFPLKYLAANDTLSVNKSRFIIKGRVLKQIDGFYSKYRVGLAHNIKILEYWPKTASLPDTLTIIDDDPYCPASFQIDSTYLIAGFSMNRYMGTSSCLGTGLFSRYKNQINDLGKGKKPEKVSVENRRKEINYKEQSDSNKLKWIIYSFLAGSLILNAYLIVKLRKRQ